MANDYYTASGAPSTGSQGSSSVIRGEYNLLVAAFDKLPALTGNGGRFLRVNSGGAALESVSAATLKAALDLEIGTDLQAQSARLDEIAALAVTDGNIIVGEGASWVAESGATARTSLGLAIGTNVQAYDAGLTSIAGLTTAADRMIYTAGSDTYAVATLTSFARTVLDDADAATARATLEAYGEDDDVVMGSGSTTPDYGGTARRVGWNPTRRTISSSGTFAGDDLNHGSWIDTTGTTQTLPTGLGNNGDMILLITDNAATSTTIAAGAGLTLLWAQGGTQSTGNRTVANASAVTLWRLSTDTWYIFGNGIS